MAPSRVFLKASLKKMEKQAVHAIDRKATARPVLRGLQLDPSDPRMTPIIDTTGCWTENSGFSPQIIHFNRVFHYFHHPFWGTPIFGNTHFKVFETILSVHIFFFFALLIQFCLNTPKNTLVLKLEMIFECVEVSWQYPLAYAQKRHPTNRCFDRSRMRQRG